MTGLAPASRRQPEQTGSDEAAPVSGGFLVDPETVDPAHLEELAALIRERRWARAARLAEMLDKPTIGYYRRQLAGQSP